MIVMKITIDDNRFMTVEAAPDDLDKLSEFFTYQDYSECFVYGKFKKEKIKQRKVLIRKKKYPTVGLLPIGFKQDLEVWLLRLKAKYKFYDNRPHNGNLLINWNGTEDKELVLSDAEIAESLGYLTLYPYQVEAIKSCLNEGSGIIKSPTGSGKCVVGDTEIEIEFDSNDINPWNESLKVIRKKIKIKELFDKLRYYQDENTWIAPKSLKVKSENGFEKVSGLYKTNKREVIFVIVQDPKTKEKYLIKGVLEHRVLTDSGWKYLKDIDGKIDKVKTINGFGNVLIWHNNITNIESQKLNIENCYDLQVENTHSFYTNNILSHNTEMFLSLCKLTNIPTIIFFSRIALAQQTLKRMKAAGIDAGIVQGNHLDEDHQVIMATIQSAHKLKRNDYKMVITDECHRVSAVQYQETLNSNIFRYRFGFSATPLSPAPMDKWKNAQVKMWLGGIIYNVKPEELLDNQQIARPKIHIWPIDKPGGLDEYGWQGAENHGIVKNAQRNKFISKLAMSVTGQVLILCKRIEQGQELQKLIPNSQFLFGDIEDKERESITKRFDNGEDFILIASTIFDEGISIDNINHVILAGGGASFTKTLQRVGRGTRITETKKEVDIHDFMDNTNKILHKHSKDRLKIYYDYGYKDIIEHDKKEVEEIL